MNEDNKLKQLEQEKIAMIVQRDFEVGVKAEAEATAREMKMRMKEVNKRYEEQKAETHEITRDMTRQYKDMQETLVSKINLLEGTIQELKDEVRRSEKGAAARIQGLHPFNFLLLLLRLLAARDGPGHVPTEAAGQGPGHFGPRGGDQGDEE